MTPKHYLFILIFFAINSIYSSAYSTKKCKATKSYIDNYEPKVFNTTNNLLNHYDSPPLLCSDQITIRGRVVDENCAPVANARVYAWQAGCDGKYPYIPLRTKINHKLINLNSKSTFQGSGTATTDNLGEFTFITMHPLSAHINYINLRIEHKNFKNTQTKLFLNHKPSTILYNQDLDYKDNEYYFDIVVPSIPSN